MWGIPLLASIISLFFALIITGQFIQKKKVHNLLYSISLYMFSIAAFAEFYSSAFGWMDWLYKLYYFPAITLVAIMAAASIYVRSKPILGHIFIVYVFILSIVLLIQLIPAEINTTLLNQADYTIGGEAMPEEVRRYSFWLSGIGGILLLLVSIWSWWRTRLVGNLYIAAGALIMSMGGRLAKMGWTGFLTLSELIGIIVLFLGVVQLEKGRIFLQKIKLPTLHFTKKAEVAVGDERVLAKAQKQNENKQIKQSNNKNKRKKRHNNKKK